LILYLLCDNKAKVVTKVKKNRQINSIDKKC